jgi:hypothetical protein
MKATLDATKPGILTINGKKYRGKVFHVNGQELEIYSIQALAQAVGRTIKSLWIWEQRGDIPRPLFTITGTRRQEMRRWYSRTQIVNLHQVSNRFPFSRGRMHFRAPFFELFNTLFDEGEIVDASQVPVTATPGIPEVFPAQRRQRIASASAQSEGNRNVAAQTVRPVFPVAPEIDVRGHRARPVETPGEDHERHTAGIDPRVKEKTINYRRRPARSV